MATDRDARALRLLESAMAREPDQHAAFLDGACDDDGALRAEIDAMMAQQPKSRAFLKSPALGTGFHIGREDGNRQTPAPRADSRADALIGSRLGDFEILGELGRGGMGIVYEARQTSLNRKVALKVLAGRLGITPAAVLRFQREARALAALNHVNIGTIYGFEEAGDVRFLVLEFIEGDTLADRLKAGPLPVDETLAIGKQIAEALEAAHAKGIVHRDLKPANIKVDAEGHVKVLDFGLAKAFSEDSPSSGVTDLAASPTITADFTQPGVILGTAAYMSPEQARGRPIDKRTDIFSFGCVLYQCLTGERLFGGETVTDSIGAVLHKQPDWDAIPRHTPPTVQLLLRRCLAKDRKQRIQDIGDARIELEAAIADPTSSALNLAGVALAEAQHHPRRRVAVLAALFVAVAALAVFVTHSLQPVSPVPVARLSIPRPTGLNSGRFRISRDGGTIAFIATPEADAGSPTKRMLYIRRMDDFEVHAIPGTEGAGSFRFSPDGHWLAFVRPIASGASQRHLAKVATDGKSPPVEIAAWDDAWGEGGFCWLPDGDILFIPPVDGGKGDAIRIAAVGGVPPKKLRLDINDKSSQLTPIAPLPDGRTVIVKTSTWDQRGYKLGTALLDLVTGKVQNLLDDGSYARYVATGHLVFTRNNVLMACPFDPLTLRLTGGVVAVQSGLRTTTSWTHAGFDMSDNGTLVYTLGERGGANRYLVTLDTSGNAERWSSQPLTIEWEPVLSSDGRYVAVTITEANNAQHEIWTTPTHRPMLRRTGFEPGAGFFGVVLSPSGNQYAYVRHAQDDDDGVYVTSLADDGAVQRLMKRPKFGTPGSLSSSMKRTLVPPLSVILIVCVPSPLSVHERTATGSAGGGRRVDGGHRDGLVSPVPARKTQGPT